MQQGGAAPDEELGTVPTAAPLETAAPRPPASSTGELPALRRLLGGRYLLRHPVGEGGMAVVWWAYDTQLKRDVALKLLHEHVLPVDRERFGREIRTLARLRHPGVIGIHDLGEDDGRVYFTMELLEGGPISDLGPLEDTPEDLERFGMVAREAALALAHVHAQGMVHRDLTPRNILLGADGRPRIMDFGLVYVSDATRDLTRTGYTLGTPQYMAPEQAKGAPVGPAADVYALGAVLYRTAAGRAPFEADNDQSILYQHVYEPPPGLDSLNPAVPITIAETLVAMLHKEAAERPADPAEQIEAALERVRREHVPGTYRGGRARAGVHPGGPARPERLRLAWETRVSGELAWPTAITASRDLVALGTRAGTLALLELGSGARHAELPAGDEVTAPASFDGDAVVYGAWDGIVRCADARTGVQRWSHRTRGDVTGAPTRWGGAWLLTSRDGHVHAVSAADGRLGWAHKTGAAIAGSIAMWGGLAIVADEDGWVHALDPTTGAGAWRVQVGAVHATPALARRPSAPAEAVLVVPTWSGDAHALRLARDEAGRLRPDDEMLWSYDLEGEAWASPAICGDRVFLASWSGRLRALSLETGDDLWELDLGARLTASPVVSRGVVYTASEGGEIVAASARTGRVLWRDRAESGVQATPLVVDASLVVGLMDGRVRCYRET